MDRVLQKYRYEFTHKVIDYTSTTNLPRDNFGNNFPSRLLARYITLSKFKTARRKYFGTPKYFSIFRKLGKTVSITEKVRGTRSMLSRSKEHFQPPLFRSSKSIPPEFDGKKHVNRCNVCKIREEGSQMGSFESMPTLFY